MEFIILMAVIIAAGWYFLRKSDAPSAAPAVEEAPYKVETPVMTTAVEGAGEVAVVAPKPKKPRAKKPAAPKKVK